MAKQGRFVTEAKSPAKELAYYYDMNSWKGQTKPSTVFCFAR